MEASDVYIQVMVASIRFYVPSASIEFDQFIFVEVHARVVSDAILCAEA